MTATENKPQDITPSQVRLHLRKHRAITATCDGCGAANGIRRHGEYQCPKCTQMYAITDAAQVHYKELLREVLLVLHDAYEGTRAMEQMLGGLGAISEDVAHEVANEWEQAKKESEVNA